MADMTMTILGGVLNEIRDGDIEKAMLKGYWKGHKVCAPYKKALKETFDANPARLEQARKVGYQSAKNIFG